MNPIKNEKLITGNRVYLSKPIVDRMDEFLDKANASKNLHALWTKPPLNQNEFMAYLARIEKENQEGFFISLNETNEIIGVININEIVKDAFNSGYLGCYCFSGYEKQGLMSEGLWLLMDYAFNTMKLHRLEANIQPDNINSLFLVTRCGFVKEGYSKKYLNIDNKWQDHVRYALTTEVFDDLSKKNRVNLTIKQLEKTDIEGLAISFEKAGLNKTISLFNKYYEEQKNGQRLIWLAQSNENYTGYVTLVWGSLYKPFAKNNIPEIKDINVLPDYRKQGICTALLKTAETKALEKCLYVGIGVGLYEDYGAAQKLYLSSGYLPDGNGITYDYKTVNPGKTARVDDELCLWLVKSLKALGVNYGD